MHFQLEFAIPKLSYLHSRFKVCKLEFHVCLVSKSPSTTSVCHPSICKVPIKNLGFVILEFHICFVLVMHLQFELAISEYGRFLALF